MHRFAPTRFTAPLYVTAALAAGLFALLYPALSRPRQVIACAVFILLLLALLAIRFHLSFIESIVYSADLLSEDDRRLPITAQLRLIMVETSGATRREVSSALADTQAEIDALQSQINPHFLYNTLDSIRGRALIDGSPVIADMTEALSTLFRYSISRSGNLVTLQEELRCIEKYLMIQQFRFSGKFALEKQIDEGLLSCLIPRLTLQPIVENAIYHGLETRAEGGVIVLSLTQSGGYLIMRISDNGNGIAESQLLSINEKLRVSSLASVSKASKKGSGIALANIHRRIRLVFGECYGLIISSTPGTGTDVEIILPVLHDGEQRGGRV